MLHVIPVLEKYEELSQEINSATRSRTEMPSIVIDSVNSRDNEPVYSMAQREEAYAYLVENMDELKIDGVGYTADKIAVFMVPDATESDMEKVSNVSLVKAIEFFEGGLISEDFMNENPNVETESVSTRASATTLRGGNWAYRTPLVMVGLTVYASDGSAVGTADVRLYNGMDVTFVELYNTNLNSHGYMIDGSRITHNTTISSTDIGKSIEKFGARTGNTGGKIKAAKITGQWSVYHDNLFLTSVITQSGDSGSAFVVNNNTIAGLMIGARSTSDTTGSPDNPVYLESVALPISDVINGPGFQPCT